MRDAALRSIPHIASLMRATALGSIYSLGVDPAYRFAHAGYSAEQGISNQFAHISLSVAQGFSALMPP
jgi:hypothetical protein